MEKMQLKEKEGIMVKNKSYAKNEKKIITSIVVILLVSIMLAYTYGKDAAFRERRVNETTIKK